MLLLVAISALSLLASQVESANALADLCKNGEHLLQQRCSSLQQPQAVDSICCIALKGLQDLGCFCGMEIGTDSPAALAVDVGYAIALCGLELDTNLDRLCFSSKRKVEPSSSFHPHEQEGASRLEKWTAEEGFDYRPVLDLDDVPDGLTAIFHEGGQGEVIVAYSEAGEASWNNALNLDIELPESGGLEFDIVYSTNEEGRASGRNALPAYLIRQAEAERLPEADTFASPVNLEVNVELPEGLFKGFSQSDITIDMEYDPATGVLFNTAAITLEDTVSESSYNGKAIGNLMTDAAQYLSAELSIPLDNQIMKQHAKAIGDLSSKELLLGGALNFLSAVGEDIRDSIPNKNLHDGDIIQIQHDEDDLTEVEDGSDTSLMKTLAAPHLANRRTLVKLSEAVKSAISHEGSTEQEFWTQGCSLCTVVHRYVFVLWSLVIAGIAVLLYSIVAASARIATNPAPTNPNEELKEPLIVYAADFVTNSCKRDELLLPVWSPPKPLL